MWKWGQVQMNYDKHACTHYNHSVDRMVFKKQTSDLEI